MADPLNPAAWNRFSYVHNSPTNYVDPSGHLAWWAPFAIGFIIGSLTNVTAGVLQSDDPANYLLSQQAGIDLLVGGTFGALAVGLTPGVVTLGMAAELSAGRTLFYQAVGFGALNWMQAESSAILKHELLGYEKAHLTWEERGASFAYGFAAGVGAYFVGRAMTEFGYSISRRASQSREFVSRLPVPIRKFVNLMSTRSMYHISSRVEAEAWRAAIEDPVIDALDSSVPGRLMLLIYGHSRGFSWGIKNVLFNSNILPLWNLTGP